MCAQKLTKIIVHSAMKFAVMEWQDLSKGYISEMSVEPESSVKGPRLLTNSDW